MKTINFAEMILINCLLIAITAINSVQNAVVLKHYPNFVAFERANWTEAYRYCRLLGGRLAYESEAADLMIRVQHNGWSMLWIDEPLEDRPINHSLASCYQSKPIRIDDRSVTKVKGTGVERKEVVADGLLCHFDGKSRLNYPQRPALILISLH